MAQQVFVSITDDLDGSEADETITFGLDGTSYEIDLNEKNAAALRKALDKYVNGARKSGGRGRGRSTGPRAKRGSAGRDYDLATLREWAAKNKVKVPARGRIPQAVVEQYKSAGGR